MKKISLALIVLIIVGALFVPAVSAEVIIEDRLTKYIDTSITASKTFTSSSSSTVCPNELFITNIENHRELSYIVATFSGHHFASLPAGRTEFNYTFNGQSRPGVIYKSVYTNTVGSITTTKFQIFLNDWDIGTLSGLQRIKIPVLTDTYPNLKSQPTGQSPIYLAGQFSAVFKGKDATYTIASGVPWKNEIYAERFDEGGVEGYTIKLNRTVDSEPFTSAITLYNGDTTVYYNSAHGTNLHLWYPINDIDKIKIVDSFGNDYIYPLETGGDPGPDDPDDPDNTTVTVYVRNSQTGAAIANSRIVIDALVDDEYYPVVNSTEPSGIFSVTLQPTGGGLPNPDGYRLIASADGYNNPMPEINFTVDEYTTSIYCYLDPIAGGPLDENKTFIDFFVRDMSANPISGATVNFGGYTLLTNSQGYTVFEVGKNDTYTYTVSKSGYGPLTGNVVIGANPRHTINTVLAPAVTPTTSTPIPTSTSISPTPTMTAPTGEPVSNWLEWFAAHFGMILGGGVEIGKIFMWLCFTVPVGVYVGKEAKAGAAGFMAGAGIVTLFFVLIGWVPIWLVVLLVLIIGLLYAKVFNNSDNGGGR